MRVPPYVPLPRIPENIDPMLRSYLQALHSVLKQLLEPSGVHQNILRDQQMSTEALLNDHMTNTSRDDHQQYLNISRHDTTTRHPLGSVIPVSATPPPAIGTQSQTGSANAVARADHTHAHPDMSAASGTFHSWGQISGKPTTYPPSPHTHPPSQITPQGSGSNLDADTVDGQHASAFAPATHTHPLSQIERSGAQVGQVPQWNGTQWVPASISGGGTLFVVATAPPQTISEANYFVLGRIYVPTGMMLRVCAISVWCSVDDGALIQIYNETDESEVEAWSDAYNEPNTTYNLGGKICSFRLVNATAGPVSAWGSISFKMEISG